MKVSYQLRWLPASEPATALLVPTLRADDVLRVCVELGIAGLPPIYVVADGFLVILPAPSTKRVAGVIRLRGLSEHLLIPVNAELIPPLLKDETSALVRKRGLVFLPGGRVLEFDPGNAIAPTALIRIGPVQRSDWRALPAPPPLAQTLSEITRIDLEVSAEQILEQGGAGIGEQNPNLEGGGLPAQIAGNTLFQLGKGLAWLGQALNSRGLAGLGAKLLGGAMALTPKLSEKLMGAQEAMLRELLRQFRAGDIEKALKHALPLGADSARGAAPAGNAMLPNHNLFYSILNLLGSSGGTGGPASFWFSSVNTYNELLREYRKQADLAVSRGDFRRAAFIYAKLLKDFHSAAKVLAQGGLHRDAAILYEKKILDPVRAAKEWEAAGEIERALQLYRKMSDHLAAGDLLRRIGEEDRAVAEYQIAAAKLLESGPKHYEAGELRVRAQCPDLAFAYYIQGWQQRPEGNALSCVTRLVQHHADAGQAEPFLTALSEAETFLAEAAPESSATFFTEIARLAKTPALAPIADDVHDRALMGMAKRMRQRLQTSPSLRANLFTSPSVWPVPLVGDAQYAVTEASKQPQPAKPTYPTLQAGRSSVTAVCQMPTGSQIFLGFENGEVVVYQPATNEVHVLTRESGPILALSVDASKTYLLILSQMGPEKVCLRTVSRELGYRMLDYCWLTVTPPTLLGMPALNTAANVAIFFQGKEYRIFSLSNLVGTKSLFTDTEESPDAIVFGTLDGKHSTFWMLSVTGRRAEWWTESQWRRTYALEWDPGISEASMLNQMLVRAVLLDSQSLEITGIDAQGRLCRSIIPFQKQGAETTICHSVTGDRYSAFACPRSDLLAGIHGKGIDWWTPTCVRPMQTKVTLNHPMAAFPLPETHEILIIGVDGLLTRIPVAESGA